jgi:hypothetical protein
MMIRVRIGTDSDIHGDAEKVVEYSIRKNTKEEVDIQFIRPGWKNGCTGFTNHRFLIPEMCNYEGYAIYLDVDMLVLGDIAELWSYQTSGKWCTTPMRDDVSVIDCSAFTDLPKKEQLKTGSLKGGKYNKLTVRNQIGNRFLKNIPSIWNSIDKVEPNTKLIHYSNLKTQPWHPVPGKEYQPHTNTPAVELFFQYLEEAKANL